LASYVPSPQKLVVQNREKEKELEASERFPALDDDDDDDFVMVRPVARSSVTKPVERNKEIDDEEWLPIVEKEEAGSSDEEISISKPSSAIPTVLPPISSKFSRAPPISAATTTIQAPTPQAINQRKDISNLVHKYDSISPIIPLPSSSLLPPIASPSSSSSIKRLPPQPSTKPAQLRRDSNPPLSSSASFDFAPSTPTKLKSGVALADRLPFKPVPPPLSPASSRPLPPLASRPKPSTLTKPSALNLNLTSTTNPTTTTTSSGNATSRSKMLEKGRSMTLEERLANDTAKREEKRRVVVVAEEEGAGEEDKPFAGVSSMVSRWNTNNNNNGGGGGVEKKRKEFAVV
jgi:hypothetical protein